jgi:tetratricopeptide (TPR) repeat protein
MNRPQKLHLGRRLFILLTFLLCLLPTLVHPQETFIAEKIVNKFLATGQVSQRDLLLLMSQPREFLRYQQILRASAPELEQMALGIRRTVFQRALQRLGQKAATEGTIVQAVIALGSWAEALNAGDMDIIVAGGQAAAKEFNQLLHEEINRILAQEGDDICREAFSKGARFTLETFEIFVSTLEDFGYGTLKQAYSDALAIAAKEGEAAGAAYLKSTADPILRRNLSAQRYAAVQKEYYPGASGQDFVRQYFNKEGKSRTWRVNDNGRLDSSWEAGMTVDELEKALIRDLGLKVSQSSGAFKFPVIADELVQWVERTKQGAREQAKGLVRAYEARPKNFTSALKPLTKKQEDLLKAARILADTPREKVDIIRAALRSNGFFTEEEFAMAGEAFLWDLTKASNNEAYQFLVENQTLAGLAKDSGKLVEAEYRRIKDYLASNEQLAGYSKLKPDQLKELAKDFEAKAAALSKEARKAAFYDEFAALLEYMAEGTVKGKAAATEMLVNLLKLAKQQNRLSSDAYEEALKLARAEKDLPAEVEQAIAVLRRDLADLASIRALSPASDSMANCISTSSLFTKGQLTYTKELEELVAEISKLSDIQLLQLGFKNSEIALLREINAARAQGMRLAAVGEALRRAAPKNWRTVLKGFIEEARKAAPTYLAFGSAFALWQVVKIVNDPSIPESEQTKYLGEAIFGAFPTVGLVLDGLPMAYIEYEQGGPVDKMALAQGIGLSALEIVGLANPAVGMTALAVYAGISVTVGMLQSQWDRDFVQALYNAYENNALKIQVDGKESGSRSFDVMGVQVLMDQSTKMPILIHSPAFKGLYTREGDVLLYTGEGRKPYTTKVNVALRDYAKRYIWDVNNDLKIWAQAVRNYFPNINLDQVESWSLGEVSAQGADVTTTQFKVGARLVRRYLNQRNLLVEAALRQLKGRIMEMKQTVANTDEWEKELADIEKTLTMEGKIIPNVKAEVSSFLGWAWDAATSPQTRLEQVGGIWKRYLSTYKEAVTVYGRLTKICQTAGFQPPAAADLFGLVGVEAKDKPKIDQFYQAFHEAYNTAYQEYREAKGGEPDPKDAYDKDAFLTRLISLRMRLLFSQFQKTTQSRTAALEKEIKDLLNEVREHYSKPVIEILGKGDTEIEEEKTASFEAVPKAKNKSGETFLKQSTIEWFVNDKYVGKGPTLQFGPGKEGTTYRIRAYLVTLIQGKRQSLAYKDYSLTVSKKKKTEETKPETKKEDPKTDTSPKIVALKFSGTAPGNWEGGLTKDGELVLTRKPAKAKISCQDATVTATLKVSFNASPSKDAAKSKDEALALAEKDFKARRPGDTPNDMAVGLFMAGGTEGVSAISMGDYNGAIADFAIWVRRGSWSPEGGGGPHYMGCNGRGTAPGPGGIIQFKYNVWGGGCYDNADRAYLVSQCAAAQEEAKAILASLKPGPDGDINRVPYKGPNYDGSDLPKVVLVPSSVEKLKVGDRVTFTAEVQNAKPEDSPFTHNWSGEQLEVKPEELKKSSTASIKASKPGKFSVGVGVDGARFGLGGASVNYEVADIKVKIERLAPIATGPVPMGAKTGFKATVTSDGKESPGPYVYRWQPYPEAQFDKLDATTPTVKALFTKPGRVKVWVQILEQKGKVLTTLVESEQIEIDVIKPKLTLKFEPKEPLIGQEVKLTVEEQPKMDDKTIDFWWEIKGNTTNPGPLQGNRHYTFKPKDNTPTVVTVHAKAKDGGDDLGQEEATIKAKSFDITISPPRYLESPPQLWKCDTQLGGAQQCGLVSVKPTEFAVFRDLFLKADIKPAAENPRYRWSVDPTGSCGLPGSGSEIKLNCSNTGTYTVKLEVTNADGAKLGEATQSVNISISQAALDGSKKAQNAYNKLTQAKQLVAQGKLDEGLSAIGEAQSLDPKNSEAAGLATKWKSEKTKVLEHTASIKKLLDADKLDEADKELKTAKTLHPKYQPVVDAEKLFLGKKDLHTKKTAQSGQLLQKAKQEVHLGKLDEALASASEAVKVDPKNAEAVKYIEVIKKEKETAGKGLEGVKKLMDEAKFQEASNALIPLKNKYSYYPPVQKMDTALSQGWRGWDSKVQEALGAVRMANERKEFAKALDLAKKARELKPGPYLTTLTQQEEWAKRWETEKEQKRKILKSGEEKLKQNDYDGAYKAFQEGFANGNNLWAASDPEPNYYGKLREEAFTKQKKIGELLAVIRYAAEQTPVPPFNVLEQASKTVVEAMSLQPANPQIKQYQAAIEARRQKAKEDEVKAKEAKKWRDQGEALQKQNKLPEAIISYRESLKFIPDKNLEAYIAKLEGEIKKGADQKKTADQLWQEGTAALNQGAPEPALGKFKQSVQTLADPTRIKYVQDLEARRARAEGLRTEGANLQQRHLLKEALAKYQESLAQWPDQKLKEQALILEGEIKKAGDRKQIADRLWQEGTVLLNQGKPAEGLAKFKESLQQTQEPERVRYVQDLEARRAKAQGLRDEGAKFQQQNLLKEAAVHYNESLQYWPDPALKTHVTTLEAKINQTQELENKKARAKQLRDTAYAFQQQNRTSEAIAKYKESLAVWPDPQLTDYVKQLEAKLAASAGHPPAGVSTPPTSQSPWTGTWKARGKDHEEVSFALNQLGTRISGTYTVVVSISGKSNEVFRGRFDGTASGNKANGNFVDEKDSRNVGTWEATLSPDLKSFSVTIKGGPVVQNYTMTRQGGSPAAPASPAPVSSTRLITADVTNKSSQNAHIFIQGESFGPSNRFAPGERRSVQVPMTANGTITFVAGKEGRVLATKTWQGDPNNTNRFPTVIFDESNPYDKLIVSTHFR